MFKSLTIPWKVLVTLASVSILLAACAANGPASSTTGSSELATPSSGTGAEQVPTIEVGQAQTQPTESVAQAPTTAAATEAPTAEIATAAPTAEMATAAPTTTEATEAPTTAAGAVQAPTVEATTVSTTTAVTPEATVASSAGVTSTTPSATPVGTPSTLPVTGGSDDGAAGASIILLALGAVLLLGAFSLASARRSHQ